MKKWMVIMISLSPIIAFSQNQIGVKGGLNFTNVNPIPSTLGSINAHVGGFYSIETKDKWIIQPEILFASCRFYSDDFGGIKLSYMTIPLVFKYSLFPKVNIQVGAQYGVLLASNSNNNNNSNDYLPFNEIINPSDFSAVLGVGFELLKHLQIEGRLVPEVSRMLWGDEFSTYRKATFQVSICIPLSRIKLKEALDVRDWEEPVDH